MCNVSVIIPVYNVEKYLDDCLQSVLQQDFAEMEILCIDDGSTDGSLAVLKRYAAQDARVKIIPCDSSKGPGYARNRGLEKARGAYIFFLDSDDMIPVGAIKRVYQIASSECLDVLGYTFYVRYEDGTDDNERLLLGKRNLSACKTICTGQQLVNRMLASDGGIEMTAWTGLWKRSYLEENQIRFHEGILHEDVPFAIIGLFLAERARMLPEPCYIYRRRGNSITSKRPGPAHVRGRVAGFADILELAYAHRGLWTAEGAQALCALLEGQKGILHRALLQYGGTSPETLPFDDAGELLACQLALRNGCQYVKGYLTEEAQQRLRGEQDIVIYGSGRIGREIVHLLEDYGIRNYHLAVTKKTETGGTGFVQLIHELQEYRDKKDQALVILAAGARYREEMEEYARSLGFQRVVRYYELL